MCFQGKVGEFKKNDACGNHVNIVSSVFASGVVAKLSQMPIVLIPIHFDRDPINHIPSCQRSVVIRTFITNDFMTGIPATPGKQIPFEVWFCFKKNLSLCFLCL